MSTDRHSVFVDSGAWIALALTQDPFHARAQDVWTELRACKRRLVTSIPVVVETFTFLDRNAGRDTANRWRDQVTSLRQIRIVECTLSDLTKAVDGTSFVIMRRLRIATAFAFDQHFAQAGFTVLG
jgi:uncharacterized protein